MQRHSYVRRCGGLEPHSEMRRRHGERSRGGRALKRRVGRVWGLQLTPPPAHSGSPRLHRNPERPAGLTPRAGTWNPPCETHGTGAQNLQAAAAHGKGARGTGAGGGSGDTGKAYTWDRPREKSPSVGTSSHGGGVWVPCRRAKHVRGRAEQRSSWECPADAALDGLFSLAEAHWQGGTPIIQGRELGPTRQYSRTGL